MSATKIWGPNKLYKSNSNQPGGSTNQSMMYLSFRRANNGMSMTELQIAKNKPTTLWIITELGYILDQYGAQSLGELVQ